MRHRNALPAFLAALAASCGGAPGPAWDPGAARVEGAGHPALWWVKVGDGYGYVDATGEIVIEPRFTSCSDFSEGLAVFRTGGGHWVKCGYVDRAGKVVVRPRLGDAWNFSEGRAVVRAGARWGYIDSRGAWLVRPRFDYACSFSEGLARVRVPARPGGGDGHSPGGRWGYIDRTGRMVIPARFSRAADFSEGLACVATGGGPGDAWSSGHIDRTGRFVLRRESGPSPHPYYLGSFSEGRAQIMDDGKLGFVDRSGKVVIEPRFDRASSFSEGLARVWLREKELYGYIDSAGTMVIEPRFAEAGDFHEGLAPVCIERPGPHRSEGDRWGYIDMTGDLVVEGDFNAAFRFRNGLARVHVGGEYSTSKWEISQFMSAWRGGEWRLIDRKGERVWPK
ncbi:MAG: WG repeat-containing protein [Planctomycetota bacterium]